MKVITIDWRDKDDFVFIPMGDLHIGSKATDYRKIKGVVDYAIKHNIPILGMGDYLQFETKSSVGDKFECSLTNFEQIEVFENTFKNANVIGLLSGNHDGGRSNRDVSVNIVELLAQKLTTEFLGEFGIIIVSMKKLSYVIACWHGHGSASTNYGVYKKMIGVADRKFRNADLYLQGHFHRFVKFPDRSFFQIVPNRKRNKLELRTQHFVDTGSFQAYASYADRLNLAPVELGCWQITLSSKKREIFFKKIY